MKEEKDKIIDFSKECNDERKCTKCGHDQHINQTCRKNKEKSTFVGAELKEKIEKAVKTRDKGPEAREVTKEWGKKFLKDLDKIIEDPKYKKWNKLYIKVLAKKTIVSAELVSVVYGITNIPPTPDWKNALYSYDRNKEEWKLEWVLPQAPQIAEVMLAHEEGFDPFLIQCIKNFKAGLLPGQEK